MFLGIYRFAFTPPTQTVMRTTTSDSSRDNDKKSSKTDRKEQTEESSGETSSSTSSSTPSPYTEDRAPSVTKSRIIPVSRHAVVSPYVDEEKQVIRYYAAEDGTVWEVPLLGGSPRSFSDVPLKNFVYAAWAPDGQRVLTKFVDPSGGTRIYFFDHRTQKGVPLKPGVDRVDWTTVGDRILYTYFDSVTRRTTLNVAQPDGSQWRVIARDIPRGSRFVNIPQSSRVAFWRAPNPFEKTRLQVVNLLDASPSPKTLFQGHYNADYLFSPNGQIILISSTVVKGSNERMLGVANANGGEYRPLRIPTNVSKCAWSKDSVTIYCAFPTADRDTFWKINVTTNKKDRVVPVDDVVSSAVRYKVSQPFLSPDEDALFFINMLDQKLYRIQL